MSMPRISFTVIGEALRGQQFTFDGEQPISIGRTPENALALDHKSVSRRHARVDADGGGFVLHDLGSHNGTRVGDTLVSKHTLQPGDVIGLGEILLQFAPLDGAGAAAPPLSSALPAIVTPAATQDMALGRPVSLEEMFAQATATAPLQEVKPRRNYWPAIYGLLLAAVVTLGILGFWAVGQRPTGLPRLDVQVRAGETLPVNLAVVPAPDRTGLMRGITRAEEIGQPSDLKVADARRTRFRGFVAVQGKALGTTDIPIYGPPAGCVVLRVLVRGVKPPPYGSDWMNQTPADRKAHAYKLIQRARTLISTSGMVNEQTGKTILELDLAAKLLEAIPGETTQANWASQTARDLRQAVDKRYETLARETDVLREQGKYPEALAKALELKSLYQDPESEEYHVVNMFYDSLADEAARAEREAQEKR